MSVDTKGFLYSSEAKSFDYLPLIEYIKENYSITAVEPGNGYMAIYFRDGNDIRQLMVWSKYMSYINEDYPEFKNTTRYGLPSSKKSYIVLFDLPCWGNSGEIIKGIVEYFGGGYFIKNDCEDEWETIEGKKETKGIDSIEWKSMANEIHVAYRFLRENSTTISSEAIELMKEASLNYLKG